MQGKFIDNNLIFILSQPRSGSTLLQLLLGGHPDIATASEPWLALHPLYSLHEGGIAAEYDAGLARIALLQFLKDSGVSLDEYRGTLAEQLLFLYGRNAAKQGKKYFLDKTPRYYHIATELLDVFPNARFVVLFRNPMAVLNSIVDTWVHDDWARLNIYRHDLVTAPGMLVDFCEKARGRCIRVGYEDLAGDPEGTLIKLCDYLGVTFSEKLLSYDKDLPARWRLGDKTGAHNRDAADAASIDKWATGISDPKKRYLFSSYLQQLGAGLVEKMGYDYQELSALTGAPERTSGIIPWHILMRDNDTSLHDRLELRYYESAASINKWHMRLVFAAGIFSLKAYRSLKAVNK